MTEMETTPGKPSTGSLFGILAGRGIIASAYSAFQRNATGGEHSTCLCAAAILPASYLSLPFSPHWVPAWNVATS